MKRSRRLVMTALGEMKKPKKRLREPLRAITSTSPVPKGNEEEIAFLRETIAEEFFFVEDGNDVQKENTTPDINKSLTPNKLDTGDTSESKKNTNLEYRMDKSFSPPQADFTDSYYENFNLPCEASTSKENNNEHFDFPYKDGNSKENTNENFDFPCEASTSKKNNIENFDFPCEASTLKENNNENFDYLCEASTSKQNNNYISGDDFLNFSVASANIVLESPSSSFTIPTPGSSAVSSPACIAKKYSKIRKRNVTKWKDVQRKRLKNSGKTYTNRKGEEMPEKKMKAACECSKKCSDKIEEEDREYLFKSYWELGTHEKQWNFISKYVTSHEPFRIKAKGPNRSNIYVYTLPKKNDISTTVTVCRTMFLNTLSISEKTVRTVFQKINKTDNEHDIIDMRGKHQNRPKKSNELVVHSIKDHILSLKPVESHYCRKTSTKLYLDGNLTYKKLYALYVEWFDQEKYGPDHATFRTYSDKVNEHFNIAFYKPKKDICDKCHAFENSTEHTEQEIDNHKNHLDSKDLARSIKDADKKDAINTPDIVTACFDMQKILTCPFGNIGIFYYKRKLNLYNFTVFDVATKQGFCYMWTENMGKKGANEIASGLNKFINTKVGEGAKDFRFWSDNCSGQNRNRIIFAFYQYVVQHLDIKSITHRFLEVGHTQNEGDCVHSVIENASRNKTIYTPDQWYNLVRWAKISGEPYRVSEMRIEDIFDYRPLLEGKNWTKNVEGQKIHWNKIKEISVTKQNPQTLKYKYDLNEEPKIITTDLMHNKRKTKKKQHEAVRNIEQAFKVPLKIKYDKYRDLKSLCDSKIIPEEFHSYFKSLVLTSQ